MTSPLAENTVCQMDALDLLRALPDASVDCVLTDPPYGTTACAWDTPIDLPAWWAAVRRIVKPRAAIVMTGNQPFTSVLVTSNLEMFKYAMVWTKSRATDFIRAKLKPMGQHEDVLVFSLGSVANGAHEPMNYFPQGVRRVNKIARNHSNSGGEGLRGAAFIGRNASNFGPNNKLHQATYLQEFEGYPSTVLSVASQIDTTHPTQKPVALFEYLIRTYTRPGDLVVDPFGGSGTTAVAARNLGRRYITGDTDAGYCAIMRRRLSEPYTPQMFAEEADAADDAPRQVEMFEEA